MTYLKDLTPGMMFRRATGKQRYVVSHLEDTKGGHGAPSRWCYNLDGESDGYWMDGNTNVAVLPVTPNDQVALREEPQKFWMCFVKGGMPPTVQHQTEIAANNEAERLAKVTGKRVFVLEAISYVDFYEPIRTGWKWTTIEED